MSGSQKTKSLTTKKMLSEALMAVKPVAKHLPGYEGYMSRVSIGDMDEVYPQIYVGDIGAANNVEYLRKVGITHVLNAAHGDSFGSVNTNADLYERFGMKFIRLDLNDMPSANISKYFDISAQFIEDALSGGGRVLVHCYMGISRSATITCAFLMMKRGMTAVEALQQIRKNRCVCPNDGFLTQLAELDNALVKQRTNP